MSHAFAPAAVHLPLGRWFPPTHAALCALLTQLHAQGQPRVAVFDWDNTSIEADIGEGLARHQLDHLLLRLTAEEFEQLWQEPQRELLALAQRGGLPAPTRDVPSQAAASFSRAVRAYRTLCRGGLVGPHILLGRRASTLAIVGNIAHQHQELALGLFQAARLAYSVAASPVTGAVYAAIAQLCGGFSPAEIGEIAGHFVGGSASVDDEATMQMRGPEPAGPCKRARPLPEIRDLMAALTAAGTDVWVVTASPEYAVRAVASAWRYPVAPERVVGVRLAGHGSGDNARLGHALCPGEPITFRAGKVQAIARHIGAPPVLVAGDAMTDYEMLTQYPETAVRLLIVREPMAPPLRALARQAWVDASPPAFAAGASPTTLLQGTKGPGGSWGSAAPLS